MSELSEYQKNRKGVISEERLAKIKFNGCKCDKNCAFYCYDEDDRMIFCDLYFTSFHNFNESKTLSDYEEGNMDRLSICIEEFGG